jgi:hypothetical protein
MGTSKRAQEGLFLWQYRTNPAGILKNEIFDNLVLRAGN